MSRDRDQQFLTYVQQVLLTKGYRLEQDPDGTQYVIRPDGSVALTARKPKVPQKAR